VKVPIQNLYYLFCYAWRFIPEELAIDIGAEDCPDVCNLCGHVLVAGIDRLLRRGLDRGYEQRIEESARVRGRIDVAATMNALPWLNAKLVCRYDDLSTEVLHNQILRSTVRLLTCAPSLDPILRNRLHETDRRLTGITVIPLTDTHFRRVQLHRNNGFYAFLMRVCELVHSCLLADRSGEGPSWFRDVLSDEDYMAAVFEEFIRNLYSLKQAEFTVGRSQPKWRATAEIPEDLRFLPTMTTDVTLSSFTRRIIIDAKYYRVALQTHHGKQTVHSHNLYQLMAYLRGTAASTTAQTLEGMLVYPVGEQSVDLRLNIDGYPIRIYTLNLAQPWNSIESDLLSLIGISARNQGWHTNLDAPAQTRSRDH
jgi:5-methylcytosine-specific restriction enzyme subunit McrC